MGGLIFATALAAIGVIFTIIVSVAGKLVADDIKAWIPRLISRLIDCAITKLPEAQRARYAEEWRAHVNDVPGDLSKLFVALRLLPAAGTMLRGNSWWAHFRNRLRLTVDAALRWAGLDDLSLKLEEERLQLEEERLHRRLDELDDQHQRLRWQLDELTPRSYDLEVVRLMVQLDKLEEMQRKRRAKIAKWLGYTRRSRSALGRHKPGS